MLGDSFVTVTMSDDATSQKPIPPGTVVHGERASSMADLQRQIGEVLPRVDDAVENIKVITDRLKNQVFDDTGVKNLQITLANFRTTSEALEASSGEIRGIASQASIFLKKGNETMDSARGAAGDLNAFIANLRQHGIIFYRDTVSGTGSRKQP